MIIEEILKIDSACKQPAECTNITEVRNGIDTVDKAILDLLQLRFAYVREVVKYKANDQGSIEAPARRQAVLETRSQWAAERGLSPVVVGQIYDTLVQYFIDEEKKIKNNLINNPS